MGVSVRIRTFDELTDRMEADRALLHLAAFGSVASRRNVEILRRKARRYSEYVGVFAAEGERLVGQVLVERIPYAFPDGPGTVAGIAAVATRPDRGRSGVARRLLEEAVRREKEAGIEYALLWTNRSWGAHRLYERLGFRDVYSSPWVVGGVPPPRGRVPALSIRAGGPADLERIEELHDALTRGRLGFVRRTPGTGRALLRVGVLDPAHQLLVARRGGAVCGYAHFDRGRQRVVCGELLGRTRAVRRELVLAVEGRAGHLTTAFQHTFVTDEPGLFRGVGAAQVPVGWYAMMGLSIGREWPVAEAVRRFATRDPRFVCLAGDRF